MDININNKNSINKIPTNKKIILKIPDNILKRIVNQNKSITLKSNINEEIKLSSDNK